MNNSELSDKPKNQKANETFSYKALAWLKSFFMQHKNKILSAAMLLAISMYLKKGIYDKIMPISEVMQLLKSHSFDKVISL